jgi:lysophospholipase L1-like esterase
MIRFARRTLGATLALGLLVSAPAPAAADEMPTQAAADEVPTQATAGEMPTQSAADEVPTRQSIKIMPLGDSITYGVGTPGLDSYRTDLYRRLTNAGLNVDFVGSQTSGTGTDRNNEGHPGWTITQISANIDHWLDAYEPDVILLHIGTNDMTRGLPDPVAHMATLLDRIHRRLPDAQIFVAEVTGLGVLKGVAAQGARTLAFNNGVERLVAARGLPFHLVDHSRTRGMAIVDRVHPNAYGFKRMAWTWYRALEPTLNDTGVDWPATDDPNQASSAYLCVGDKVSLPAYALGCHRWFHKLAPGAINTRVWQLRALVNGKWRWYTAP